MFAVKWWIKHASHGTGPTASRIWCWKIMGSCLFASILKFFITQMESNC